MEYLQLLEVSWARQIQNPTRPENLKNLKPACLKFLKLQKLGLAQLEEF